MDALRIILAAVAAASVLGCEQAPQTSPTSAEQSPAVSDMAAVETSTSAPEPQETVQLPIERRPYTSSISLDATNWREYGEGEYPLSIVNVYLSCRQRSASAPREVWVRTVIGNYGLNPESHAAGWERLHPNLRRMRDGRPVSLSPMIDLGSTLCGAG